MSSELFDNISYLLKVNYDNNLLSIQEYNQIKSSLYNLSIEKLYIVFNKLKYLKDQNAIVESSIGFIPFNLGLEMDGISGIKI